MNIGVIGKGKTGQAVIDVLGTPASQVFSRSNPFTMESAKGLGALIVFVPAEGFREILPNLLECGLPVVCGTTGYVYPETFDAELKKRNLTWIIGSNFSPGMNFFFAVGELVKRNREFLGNPELSIYDLHHIHKKDAPSGTALKLQAALGGEAPIKADRLGDHPGLHELMILSELEKLTFKHEAQSRRAFAEGAVYAAKELLPTLKPGVHAFETLMKKRILAKDSE